MLRQSIILSITKKGSFYTSNIPTVASEAAERNTTHDNDDVVILKCETLNSDEDDDDEEDCVKEKNKKEKILESLHRFFLFLSVLS